MLRCDLTVDAGLGLFTESRVLGLKSYCILRYIFKFTVKIKSLNTNTLHSRNVFVM